jgi:hypothetical protein
MQSVIIEVEALIASAILLAAAKAFHNLDSKITPLSPLEEIFCKYLHTGSQLYEGVSVAGPIDSIT